LNLRPLGPELRDSLCRNPQGRITFRPLANSLNRPLRPRNAKAFFAGDAKGDASCIKAKATVNRSLAMNLPGQ
jgi:hypothetical protein